MNAKQKVNLYRRLLRRAQAELQQTVVGLRTANGLTPQDFPDTPFWITVTEMRALQRSEPWIQVQLTLLRRDPAVTHRFVMEQDGWSPGFVGGHYEQMYLVRLIPSDWTAEDVEAYDNPNWMGD